MNVSVLDYLRIPRLEDLPPRIRAKIAVDPKTGRWNWIGNRRNGYGRVSFRGRLSEAHRVVWELLVGPIPSGLTYDHLEHVVDETCSGGRTCLHRRDVNPFNGSLTTNRENVMRGLSPTAVNSRKDQCIRGHLFDVENTYLRRHGSRGCKKCIQIKNTTYPKTENGRAAQRAGYARHYARNRIAILAAGRRRYARDRIARLAVTARYRKTETGRAVARAAAARYRARHKDEINARARATPRNREAKRAERKAAQLAT